MYVDPALVYWLSLICAFSLGIVVGAVGLTVLAFNLQNKRKQTWAQMVKERREQLRRELNSQPDKSQEQG